MAGDGEGWAEAGIAGACSGTGVVAGGLAGAVEVCGIPEADFGSADGGVWARIAPLAQTNKAKVKTVKLRCIGSRIHLFTKALDAESSSSDGRTISRICRLGDLMMAELLNGIKAWAT